MVVPKREAGGSTPDNLCGVSRCNTEEEAITVCRRANRAPDKVQE